VSQIDFKLNDSLIRRTRDRTAAATAEPELPTVTVEDIPSHEVLNRPVDTSSPTPAESPSTRSRAPDGIPGPAAGSRQGGRVQTVQTSVLLPAPMWEHLNALATETGSLTSTNQVLIMILQAHGGNLERVGEDLNRFLASSDDVLTAPWQERNVRLPINVRHNLDLLRDALISAGLDQATRSHLIAAILTFHTPKTGEQVRELVAEQRAETLRRALATIKEQARS
jgi:hypothetical protein